MLVTRYALLHSDGKNWQLVKLWKNSLTHFLFKDNSINFKTAIARFVYSFNRSDGDWLGLVVMMSLSNVTFHISKTTLHFIAQSNFFSLHPFYVY